MMSTGAEELAHQSFSYWYTCYKKGSKMRQSPQLFGSAAMFIVASMHDASAFSANFSWAGIRPCGGVSPAFTIHDAPKETESLHFIMSDKDAPHFQHGGSTVPYYGDGHVPEGAVDYIGPCPPAGAIHRYIWTIEALDKSGTIIARATAEGRFPER